MRQKLQRLIVVEIFWQLQGVCWDKLWQNSWLVAAGKRLQAESFQKNLQNEQIGREETFIQTLLNIHVE